MPPSIPEILPADLARVLERREPIQVLDIRAPFSVAAGRIDLATDDQFHNIVGSRLATVRSASELPLDPDIPVAVVCGHGNSSKPATQFMQQLGFEARSLRGGMAAWMLLAVRRDLPVPSSLDHVMQFDRVGKGALGYLVVSDGQGLVIDPPRDTSAYTAALDELGATLVGVADTHVHADYVSGGPTLAAAKGVPYYLHPDDAIYPYDGTKGPVAFSELRDGSTIGVGRATVRAVHTPGHTNGHLTYMVDDALAFTGDFIFVSSVGRPDLAGKTEEWAQILWRSVEGSRSWPDAMRVYPAHYATDGERNADRTVGKSLGEIRASNAALAIGDEHAFTTWITSRAGSFPESYRSIKAVNVGLLQVTDLEAEQLEIGKNECAVA